MQSHTVRKEKPTKRPREPPSSATKETAGYTQSSFSRWMLVEA